MYIWLPRNLHSDNKGLSASLIQSDSENFLLVSVQDTLETDQSSPSSKVCSVNLPYNSVINRYYLPRVDGFLGDHKEFSVLLQVLNVYKTINCLQSVRFQNDLGVRSHGIITSKKLKQKFQEPLPLVFFTRYRETRLR